MPDLDNFGEFQEAVNATGGQPGTHWLGDLEQSKLFARFTRESVQVFEVDKEQQRDVPKLHNGLPVYEEVIHINVHMPGGDVTTRLMREEDKHVYKAAWDAFERHDVNHIDGIPLQEWPLATPQVVATLNAAGVFNVEGLAALSDAHCETIGNIAFMYRSKAQEYISKAAGENRELEALKEQNASMGEMMAKMQEQIDLLNAQKEKRVPRKRGRPPGSKTKVKANVATDDDPGHLRPAEPTGT